MHRAPGQRRKLILLLGVALAAAGLSILIYTSHLLRRPEQLTIDARFQIRGTERKQTAGMVSSPLTTRRSTTSTTSTSTLSGRFRDAMTRE